MIVKDILEFCINKANLGKPDKIDQEVYSFALKALNSVSEEVWKSYAWVNSRLIGLSITTDSGIISLPNYVDYVKAVRIGSTNVEVADEVLLSVQDPDLLDSDGTNSDQTLKFIHLPPASVLRQPNELCAVVMRSTHSSDSGKIVKIQGIELDVEHPNGDTNRFISEKVTLNGVDAVFARRNYDEITGLSKEATTGRIYVEDEDGNILATMEPSEDRTSFKRIKVMPFEEGVEQTIQVIAKRKFLPMVDDYDVFPVERAEGAIKCLLVAELLEYDQKLEQASAYRAKAVEYFKNAVEDENGRQYREQRIIPMTAMFSEVGTL